MLTEAQQEQFTTLWTGSQPEVGRYIASLIPDPEQAKDVLQKTSLSLLRKFSDYDPDRPFLPWALGVAKYEILGHRRDAARCRIVFDSEFLDQYTHHWAEAAPAVSDDIATLQQCLRKLPQCQSNIVKLRYIDGCDSNEISETI